MVHSTKEIRLSPTPSRPRPHPRCPLTRPSLGMVRRHLSILAARRLLAGREVGQVYPQRVVAAT